MLLRAAKARALVHGRDHALPDDVQALADAVLSHRLMLAPEAAGVQRDEIVAGRDHRRPGAVGRMRSALGCAALGLLLLVVAGTFDAEPLYVTGAALLLLGAGAAGVDRDRRRAARSSRARSVTRSVIEEQPLHVKLHVDVGPPSAASGLDRRAVAAVAAAAAGRAPPSPGPDRGHVRAPRPPSPAAARARAARSVRSRAANRDRTGQ